MAQVVRALCYQRQLLQFLSLQLPTTITTTAIATTHRLSQRRHARLQPRALRPPHELGLLKDSRNSSSINDPGEKITDDKLKKRRNRNEMKREARQFVRWGMDLASFSTPQIKSILKAASLEEEVFEALMLVKKLGSDVREGKRRQFNYIGKLLRDADAQPDLLGSLIQATKDADQSRFQALAGSEKCAVEGPQEEFHESESETKEQHEDSGDHVMLASKWIDGLIDKDLQTSNEIYSLDSVDFDRQSISERGELAYENFLKQRQDTQYFQPGYSNIINVTSNTAWINDALNTAAMLHSSILQHKYSKELRKLVRKVHRLQDCQSSIEEDLETSAKLTAAKKSLNRFLCLLAKRHLSAQNLAG